MSGVDNLLAGLLSSTAISAIALPPSALPASTTVGGGWMRIRRWQLVAVELSQVRQELIVLFMLSLLLCNCGVSESRAEELRSV